jgi:hypothetical protein
MKLVLANQLALDLAEAIWILYREDKLVEFGFPPGSHSIDRDEQGNQVFPPTTVSYVNAEPVYLGEFVRGEPPPAIDPDNLQIEVDDVVQAMQGRVAVIGGGASVTVDVSAAV